MKMDVDICYKKVISTVTDIEKTKPYLKLIFERYANYERCECYQNLSIGGVIWFRIEDNISRQFVLNYEVYYPIDGKYAESDKNDLDRRGVDIDKLATLNKEFLC